MIRSHEELDVYRMAFDAAMRVFEISRSFPREETYSLTDPMRRSSRSVCGNLAEAWRRRRYAAAFAGRLNDCEAEAALVAQRLRPKPGSASRRNAATWTPRPQPTSIRPMTTSSANSSA